MKDYPRYIEVPEDYWTRTTTADVEKVDIHWHHNGDESK